MYVRIFWIFSVKLLVLFGRDVEWHETLPKKEETDTELRCHIFLALSTVYVIAVIQCPHVQTE